MPITDRQYIALIDAIAVFKCHANQYRSNAQACRSDEAAAPWTEMAAEYEERVDALEELLKQR